MSNIEIKSALQTSSISGCGIMATISKDFRAVVNVKKKKVWGNSLCSSHASYNDI